MFNPTSIILIFLLSCSATFGQVLNCDSLISVYTTHEKIRYDTAAFCRGAENAWHTKALIIRGLGDPGHVSPCTYLAYTQYGVQLQLSGDLVSPEQEDENAGFNAIMIPRIQDSLGTNYNLLGKTNPDWIDASDQVFVSAILDMLYYRDVTDTTVKFFLDPEKEHESIFNSMAGIRFSDETKHWVDRESLLTGVVFWHNRNGFVQLMLDFKDYPNANHICQAYGTFFIPVKIE